MNVTSYVVHVDYNKCTEKNQCITKLANKLIKFFLI